MDRILTRSEVIQRTGLSRSTIQRMERRGEFPPRRQVSRSRVGWLASDIDSWLQSRPAAAVDSEPEAAR